MPSKCIKLDPINPYVITIIKDTIVCIAKKEHDYIEEQRYLYNDYMEMIED